MTPQRSPDILSVNYQNGKQTYIIPLTFTDVSDAKDILGRISYGGDVWELRVDLLGPGAGGEENIPSPQYVAGQIKALQSFSSLPILFTIRTRSQGGKFPDAAAEEALGLMILAVESGVDYIDVEIDWPSQLIHKITQNKAETKIIASYHSWTGDVSWSGKLLQEKFLAANSFGDIIKLSILSSALEDCYELGLFIKNHRRQNHKPLLAVGMGLNGQLSRITSPISLVTHPLIPFPSAPGQLNLAQVNQGRFLIGQLEKRDVCVQGTDERAVRKVVQGLQAAFNELGYPHRCHTDQSEKFEMIVLSERLDSADAFMKRISDLFTDITGRPAPLSIIDEVLSRTK